MRVKEGYSLEDAYKFYVNKGGLLDKPTYKKLCYAYNKHITNLILEGNTVTLPYALGMLWIKKYKTDGKPKVDMNKTKLLGKIIYHLNHHSDGYSARWVWSKRNALVRNLIYYSFTACRQNKRSLAKVMKEVDGHKRYFK